ncbi:hypothetical protein vBVpPvVp04M_00050 [Vibrio phage vB_Vp_PvVp04_M]|nr:hypothetical protein vBVpPvVp04M_00050 [Vibrio phage vB_Vp_PvVp04_M]
MKAYKTYQEAKIENPDSEIVVFDKPGNEHHGAFEAQISDGIGSQLMHPPGHWHICKPSDYLPTLEWFFDEGHALVDGDLVSDRGGNVIEIGKVYFPLGLLSSEGYVLRAAALTEVKVITETPEEKEAFDAIKEIDLDHPITKTKIGENESVGFRLNDSELPNGSEWKNGDKCVIKNPEGFGVWEDANKYLGSTGTVMAVFTNTNGLKVAAVSHEDEICICWMLSMLEKPESKAERERLEAAYDLWLTWCHGCYVDNSLSIDQFSTLGSCAGYLAIVDKTGHRKEQ